DGTIKVWDSATGREEFALPGSNAGEIRSVAFAPDGRTLAAGTRYGLVKIWDLPTRKERLSLPGHEGHVWSVTFTPDGKTLAGGDGDWDRPGKILLWDPATGRVRDTLTHSGEVLCLAISADGRMLAAGSWDKTVRVWKLIETPKP